MLRIRRIIETYFNRNYRGHVQKRFAEWLGDKRHRRAKNEIMYEIWTQLNVEADESTETSFRKFQDRLMSRVEKRSRSLIGEKWLKAAVVALPLISFALTCLYMKNYQLPEDDIRFVECIVPNGETRTVTLPDSSKVKLNAGTLIVYPAHFGKERSVVLNGEAYFSVVNDERRPFIVKTTDFEVDVLGTTFNVSSYTDSENSSATLESGKLNVRFRNRNNQSVELTPNEQVTYNRLSGLAMKKSVQVKNILAWTQNNIVIQRMAIEEIAKVIERKYHFKVYVNSNRLKNENITVKFINDESIDQIMHILKELVPGMQYKMEKDKLYIY